MARKFAAVVFSLGCLQASSVMALGLGELTLESFLNEPLKASVDLLNSGDLHQDEIRVRLATKEDFDKLGLERAYFLTSIRFEVITDDRGHARIVMSSDDPVLEPYLDFIVEARWPSGRMLREYTVLVDPPVFSQATPVISASARVAEVEGIPAPAKKKQETGANSGTAVDLKKSDLAPGSMPERDYNAQTSSTPAPGSRYMINRDETLWEIAIQGKPEGASVHQTMLDIQRLNPKAFIDGNINRVKAGYIIYLPDSSDISSADLASALSEVRQQNDDWREGKASQPSSTSGPSLRISAPSEDAADSASEDQREVGTSTAAMEDLDKAELERSEAEQRLVAMEEQVETLQRIVSLKDDQIAALQSALTDAGGSTESEAAAAEVALAEEVDAVSDVLDATPDTPAIDEEAALAGAEQAQTELESTAEAVPEQAPPAAKPAPIAKPAAKPAPKPQAEPSGGFMSNILYVLGAAVLAILGVILMRRRGGSDNDGEASPAPVQTEDVFSEVELKDPVLEVESVEEEAEPTAEELLSVPGRDNRGYGERKNDEYASDIEAADALAEADIYIAYGRYPQAMDLLNNAIGNEPNNPVYRLKLLEINAEMRDRAGAMEQFTRLQEINEPVSLARAEDIMDGFGASAPAIDPGLEMEQPVAAARYSDGPGLAPSPIELMSVTDEPLEADFSGLEIEETGLEDSVDDDLDLSADFVGGSDVSRDIEEDDLVIAAETNGLSTKLDLARAYLDMGDDDGAREILEEVAAEGTEELKAEARALLERIG